MKIFRYNTLLWMGLTGSLIFGTTFFENIYQAFWANQTIWWTPQSMRLPIEETKNDFEIYIAGTPLNKHLSERTLTALDKNGKPYPVVSKDITIRRNNWDRTQSSILANTTFIGLVFGASLTMMLIGLYQFFQQRKQTGSDEG
jgi:hypothetical protein